MPVGQRTRGRLDHFERAGDAAAIARLQAFGGYRIAPRQFGMQRLDAVALQPRAHGFADLGRDRRHRRQPTRQRLEIQAGAAGKNRQAILRAGFRQHLCRIGHPAAGGKIHRGIDMAIEPVRHPRLLFQCRPRREHAQVAIDLHGIGIDDDAAGFLRQFERQRRLAAGGRPCDKHRLVIFHVRSHSDVSRRHAHLQSRRPRAR